MSLLKTLTNNYKMDDAADIKDAFKSAIIEATENENITPTNVADLVSLYAEYSVSYLQEVAMTLDEPVGMQATMKFMNSLIAEFMHSAKLHYYHMEGNYSIVDKAVQKALDGDGHITLEEVENIIGDIELSHIQDSLDLEEGE